MAKRFGRNQRRRMREHIRDLTDTGEGLKRAARAEADRRNDLEGRIQAWARSIRGVLGPHHALNEKIEQLILRGSIYGRHRVAPQLPRLRVSERVEEVPAALSMQVMDLVTHHVRVMRDGPVAYGPRAIVKLRGGDGAQIHYAIDEAMLHEGRKDERFCEWLAQEIHRELIASTAPHRKEVPHFDEARFETT